MISIIIVNWNVTQLLQECLNSIFATKYKDLEVLVIDNASTDHSISLIKSTFPKVKLIENATNIGLPKAINIGLKESLGDYLVLLNPDTILPVDFFTKILEFFAKYPTTALMGPKFIDEGSVFTEPGILNTFRIYFLHSLSAKYTPKEDGPVAVNALSGACLIMPRDTYNQAGPLTEEVFMYYEDLDYCRRLRKLHLPVIYNPRIVIRHLHGQSSKQTPNLHYSNLWETFIFPLRGFLGLKNHLPIAARYRTESAIWYIGWPKQVLITSIIWLAQKLKL